MKTDQHILETFHPLQKVIILNGPPGVGKDTLADLLADKIGPSAERFAFKDSLYHETAQHFDVSEEWLKRIANDRSKKEVWHPSLNGLSPRQALIHVSEKVIKPLHGKSFFGDRLRETVLLSPCEYAIVSDGGFLDEIPPLVRSFDVQVVRLHREGYTFEGDSRSYISPKPKSNLDFKVADALLEDGKIDEALDQLLEVIV